MPAEVYATFVTKPCSWLPSDRVAAGVARSLHCAMTRLPGWSRRARRRDKAPVDLDRSSPHQDKRWQPRRDRLSHRSASQCAGCVVDGSRNSEGQRLPRNRPMGQHLPASDRCAIDQCHRQAAGQPSDYSAHGLRSGFLTEAALRNVSLLEAIDQSRHRSMQQAGSYYNDALRKTGLAARLL